MPDTGSNIIIDISGNTANMATDFASAGAGVTFAHVPIQKIAFGDDSITKRVTEANPLPVTLQSYQNLVGVTGILMGVSGHVQIKNPHDTYGKNFLKVAGTTSGGLIGVTGYIQGMTNGYPLGISGTVSINESSGLLVHGVSGTDGITGINAPVTITGGRRLNYLTDTIKIQDSVVGISGGRNLLASTDSISVLGYNQANQVAAQLFSNDGTTAGFSGDALKVAVTNTAFTATVNVSSTHGVTNDAAGNGLMVQGMSGGIGNPVIVRGEQGGSVPITTSSPISANINNLVSIDDTDILNSLENSGKPIVNNLSGIKQDSTNIPLIRNDLSSGKVKVTVSQIEQPGTIIAGTKSFNTTAQVVRGSGTLKDGVKVKASVDNTDVIFVGGFSLTNRPDQGMPLEPGESCYISINNISVLYARAASGNQSLHYLGS